MTTTTFSRYIATADYDKYLVVEGSAPSPQILAWMKTWTAVQRLWIFRNFAVISEDGRLTKLQGTDIRPYLNDIANQIGTVKGTHPVTGVSEESAFEQLELAIC